MQTAKQSQTLDLIRVLFNLNNVNKFGLIFLFLLIIASISKAWYMGLHSRAITLKMDA